MTAPPNLGEQLFENSPSTGSEEVEWLMSEGYGFTEEEPDYIINYDIKYRMGDELNEE